MKNAILGVIAVVALGVSVVMFARGSQPKKLLGKTYTVHGPCLNCGWDGDYEQPSQERLPGACPACGQRAAYQWWYCETCNHRFVPPLMRDEDPPKMPITANCPNCGSRCVVCWDPIVYPQETIAGDVKLPKWP